MWWEAEVWGEEKGDCGERDLTTNEEEGSEQPSRRAFGVGGQGRMGRGRRRDRRAMWKRLNVDYAA